MIFGAEPNATYSIYDATTGTLLGQVTTDNDGRGSFEFTLGADAPVLQEGSQIGIVDANNVTTLQGTLGLNYDGN